MKRALSAGLLIGGLLIVAVPAAAKTKIRLPTEKSKWVLASSAHFNVVSNASERSVKRTLAELEEFRAVLSAHTSGMKLNSPLPTWIYLFVNEGSFTQYKLGPDGKPQPLAGYFQPAEEANYVALDATQGTRVVFHEYVHYFLDNNIPDLPLWANEGLAEFYSTFVSRGARVEIGRPVESHLQWLRFNTMQPLDELFRVTPRSSEYNESKRVGTFYAQSWALVHYLVVEDEDRRSRFGRFLAEVAKGNDPNVAFRSIFETDPGRMLEALQQYASRSRWGYFPRPAVELPDETIRIRPMQLLETLTRLGDLLAHRRPLHAASAEAHLAGALELAPGHGPALLAMARLRERQERRDEAARLYTQAHAADPANADAAAALGAYKIRAWFETDPPARLFETPPDLLEARALLKQALDANPDQPEALVNYGKTYVLADEGFEQGLEVSRRAIELFPRRTDLIADMVITLANDGQVGEATELFDTVLVRRASDPHLLEQIRGIVEHSKYNVAVKQASSGNVDAAIEILASIDVRGAPPGFKQEIDAFTKRLEVHRAAGVYNEAVNLANAGDHAGALEILEDLMQNLPDDEELAEAIRNLHATLEE